MDDVVLRAMAKWPNVPAVYDWLGLDRRGRWRLQGETIGNVAANEFISRNYHSDDNGRWFFQNGPQRVFVTLDYTPWVYSFDGLGVLRTHTNLEANPRATWFDDAGSLLVDTEHGVGVLDDRDLSVVLEQLRSADGESLNDDALEHSIELLYQGTNDVLFWHVGSTLVPVGTIVKNECPARFSFVRDPAPPAG